MISEPGVHPACAEAAVEKRYIAAGTMAAAKADLDLMTSPPPSDALGRQPGLTGVWLLLWPWPSTENQNPTAEAMATSPRSKVVTP